MSQLVLVRGLPGSGKSTFARTIAGQRDWRTVEVDTFFYENGLYQFDAKRLPVAHQWCLDAARELLRDDYSVVVSNTFVNRWEMAPYIKLASELDARLTVVEMCTQYTNVHGVPDSVIERMRRDWEKL